MVSDRRRQRGAGGDQLEKERPGSRWFVTEKLLEIAETALDLVDDLPVRQVAQAGDRGCEEVFKGCPGGTGDRRQQLGRPVGR